ncbi:Ras family protein [Tritrichomonas foetus]|uniref:Ras family protein n=1 Tax=Tritrichomonas foetus TaxID=1144522 RepID=A0A1J4KMM2_9EUKA|nr:Ras family protein [Tritrichomonas foetus]|eukprot:OHT10942.1 Ras family protein [Tritrichomonas foetus]
MNISTSIKDALRGFLRNGQSIMKATTSIDPDDVPKQNLKLVICGDEKTGKTKLFDRITNDSYTEGYFMTIGSDYKTCNRLVPGANVNLEIWDTAGNPQYRSILPIFFQDADIVIVVYDVTNAKSFDAIPAFVTDARNWVGAPCDVAIFGTKIDSWKNPREIKFDDAVAMAERLNARYFETSAVTTQGLEDALRKMLKKALKRKRLLPDWLLTSRDEGEDEIELME